MTPAAIIADARADGIVLSLAPGGGLTFKGPRAAADKWLPILRQGKPAIMEHLARARRSEWDASDWRAYYDERAGIREYDGGMSRAEAERLAVGCCISEWLNRRPVRSPAGRCYWCGEDGVHMSLVPFGLAPDIAWLHAGCWPAWSDNRKGEAVAALKALGVGRRSGDEDG